MALVDFLPNVKSDSVAFVQLSGAVIYKKGSWECHLRSLQLKRKCFSMCSLVLEHRRHRSKIFIAAVFILYCICGFDV